MGIQEVLKGKPDLILSGVNSGSNMADDVTYSGTVAGAMEGALQGVRSIALSQAYIFDGERRVPWEVAEAHAPALLEKLIGVELPRFSFLNVNFPNCRPEEVKGVEVTNQGKVTFGLLAEQRRDGRGFPYYWLKFDGRKSDLKVGTDVNALAEGHISVTPLKLDLTDYAAQDALKSALSLE
jgi:5'-nucleotidase